MARRRGRPTTRLLLPILLYHLFFLLSIVWAATLPSDADAMSDIAKSLGADSALGWTGSDPCGPPRWKNVNCNGNRVVGIQLASNDLSGTLSPSISKLTKLTTLAVQNNKLSGTLPSFAGLSSLQTLFLDNNQFTAVPSGAFAGLTSLQILHMDKNPFASWTIPADLAQAASLTNLSAANTNAAGTIPDFLGTLPSLIFLRLSYNNLTGGLPESFAGSGIQILWLNDQQSGALLSGSIGVLSSMTDLSQVWLQNNAFSGPIPDLSKCVSLSDLKLSGNQLTGIIPQTLINLPSLRNLSLANNDLQGPFPSFGSSTTTDSFGPTNSFCLSTPGDCDSRVNVLLSVAEAMNYPLKLASEWKGNDPCSSWPGVTCDASKNIVVLSLGSSGFNGTISAAIVNLTSLKTLILSNNNLTGSIPASLAAMSSLQTLDLQNNNLSGIVPNFSNNVTLKTAGNPFLGKIIPGPSPPGSANDNSTTPGSAFGSNSSRRIKLVITILVIIVAASLFGGILVFIRNKRKSSKFMPVSSTPPSTAGTELAAKVTGVTNGNGHHVASDQPSTSSSGPNSLNDQGNLTISIDVLRRVTNNFSDDNIIGRGGFGIVYKGELPDGTKIAVKRMEGIVMQSKGMGEFHAEIAVLTKVRHRNLVALHGYCVEGYERLLVYEYMPQGTLGDHLFDGPDKGFCYLNWKQRLVIALDVARGIEYLHSLARTTFIHRDLKPSNILLGDDLRAKVSDFGLVKLQPEGKYSVETKLAGTFGYLAPEYASTGRVTTKVDVFAFGVILMEIITGRKALDNSIPDESNHLVTWFRRVLISKRGEDIIKIADSSLSLDDEETIQSVRSVAELAGYCTSRESYQRPDMSHAVHVLSPLVEKWIPSSRDEELTEGINVEIPLSVAVQRWQANEGNSMMTEFFGNTINVEDTQSSIPSGPEAIPDVR